eukprot:TRINITY_DN375_c0_g1_i3.p1 TRINITY_DN375_c0_g1~~TRINITY_DN375_c0_g1_i3.p1  ORF type:complete len:151 (-),score=19.32 TRINITY_DN375_c0_g1_i3:267-719(-)
MSARLTKELRDLQKSSDAEITLFPDAANIYRWTAFLKGPKGTPYEEGHFQLNITVPTTYPMAPPIVTFETKIFHPNVHFKKGEICLDILKTTWTPAWTLQSVCRAILALMSDPAADSPLNCDAGMCPPFEMMYSYASLSVSLFVFLFAPL